VADKAKQKPVWPDSANVFPGLTVVSAKSKYPEVVARYIDWFYSIEGNVYMWMGPPANQREALMGMATGWVANGERTNETYQRYFPDVQNGKYGNGVEYVFKEMSYLIGGIGDRKNMRYAEALVADCATDPRGSDYSVLTMVGTPAWDLNHVRNDIYGYQRIGAEKYLVPYIVPNFPIYVYLSPKDSQRVLELQQILSDYVKQETAKFITGANPLSNIGKYYSDLDTLGLKEYQGIYQRFYDAYLKSR
jgi:hypothetical protein